VVREQTGQYSVLVPVLLAMMSNTIAKGVYVAVLSDRVRRDAAWRYGVWAVLHVPLMLL
jgi:hypothetical protein